MTPQRAKELLPVITAYANGETVQVRRSDGWMDLTCPNWQDMCDYRIKPKPKLRAWKPEEVPACFVAKEKDGNEPPLIFMYGVALNGWSPTTALLLDGFVRIDEQGNEHPCGVVEGEG